MAEANRKRMAALQAELDAAAQARCAARAAQGRMLRQAGRGRRDTGWPRAPRRNVEEALGAAQRRADELELQLGRAPRPRSPGTRARARPARRLIRRPAAPRAGRPCGPPTSASMRSRAPAARRSASAPRAPPWRPSLRRPGLRRLPRVRRAPPVQSRSGAGTAGVWAEFTSVVCGWRAVARAATRGRRALLAADCGTCGARQRSARRSWPCSCRRPRPCRRGWRCAPPARAEAPARRRRCAGAAHQTCARAGALTAGGTRRRLHPGTRHVGMQTS